MNQDDRVIREFMDALEDGNTNLAIRIFRNNKDLNERMREAMKAWGYKLVLDTFAQL